MGKTYRRINDDHAWERESHRIKRVKQDRKGKERNKKSLNVNEPVGEINLDHLSDERIIEKLEDELYGNDI